MSEATSKYCYCVFLLDIFLKVHYLIQVPMAVPTLPVAVRRKSLSFCYHCLARFMQEEGIGHKLHVCVVSCMQRRKSRNLHLVSVQ